MAKRAVLLAAALACAVPVRAQEPDFTVDFGGPAREVPTGVVTGMNDLTNASPGVWRAWAESVRPRDSLVRIWLKYSYGKLNDSHVRACELAQQSGMAIMLTVVGTPGERVEQRKGEILGAPDPEPWARAVAADLKSLLNRGLPITHLELWNEPDMPENWAGTPQEFADFFAAAGKTVRGLVPPEVRVGGPGMAASYGGGIRQFQSIVRSCAAAGWKPDFLSWHEYSGYPMDQAYYDTAARVAQLARSAGLGKPEWIVSEWNCGLPGQHGTYPQLDDHRGAASFVAMTCAMSRTDVAHSLFFMLQDGPWDTDEDFIGRSVGVFTLHGAPKSVLAAMRMMRTVCELPAVPATPRAELPVNFALMATRDGARGFLAASSAFGKEEQHGRKLLEMDGVVLSAAMDQKQTERYVRGQVQYKDTGLPPEQKPAWDRLARRLKELEQEKTAHDRSLEVRLLQPPARIAGAWLIDESHANPIADADLRAKFRPFEDGWFPAATKMTLAKLRAEGFTPEQLAKVEEAFRQRSQNVPGLAPEAVARLREVFADMSDRALNGTPLELARHPSASPARVDAADWARLQGDRLTLRLPPNTSLMLEFAW